MTISKSRLCGGIAASVIMALGFGGAASAQDTKISFKGAPQFSQGDQSFKVRGRAYIDYVAQDVDRTAGDLSASNSRIRTARLGVEGKYNDYFAYKAEANFKEGAAEWEDLILEVKPNDMTSVLIGNFKSVSLENLTSSRYITFMERGAFNDVLGIGRVTTLAVKFNGDNWTLTGAVHGDNINDADIVGEETRGVLVRGTFAPIATDTTAVHLGAWARQRERGDAGGLRYRARANTNFGDRYIDSGSIGDSDTTLAAEAAVVFNNLSVQAEYANLSAERIAAGSDPDINTFYILGSVFLTGEMRKYEPNKGEFGRIKIRNPIEKGGMGAVELGLRYDRTELDVAGAARGGEYEAFTVGANWYPTTYVRFMANYTDGEADNPLTAQDADIKTFQLRAQFDF